jgi:hypothetical protein
MAWKNIKQRSLGDALIVEHKALTESAVYADSAYKNARHGALLAKTRAKNCILERAYTVTRH